MKSNWKAVTAGAVVATIALVTAGTVVATIALAPTAKAETRITLSATRPTSALISNLTGGMTPAQWVAYAPMIGQNWSTGTTPVNVDYPASITTLLNGQPTLGQSVQIGQQNLDPVLKADAASGSVVVAGLSQGAVVIDAEQAALANDPHAPPAENVTFVEFG